MDTKTALRQLKIKTGVLKRSVKDYGSYAKEKVELEEKYEAAKNDESVEEGKLKRMNEAVAETAQMLPLCKTKIETNIEALRSHMESNDENEELKEAEDWAAADAALAEATAYLETI